MSALTNPDAIPYPNDPTTDVVNDLSNWFEDQALATQAAFNKRQLGTYLWVDDAARLAQTGMKQGDTGYRLDTKTRYLFDGGTWKLATPSVTFTANKTGIASGAVSLVGNMVIDNTRTTDSTIAVPKSDGVVTFVEQGLYLVNFVANWVGTGVTGRAFLEAAYSGGSIGRVGFSIGEDTTMLSGSIFVTTPLLDVSFRCYHTNSGALQIRTQQLGIIRIA